MSIFSTYHDADGEVLRIRSIFSPRLRVAVPVSEKASRTKRSPDHVRSADINFIVARYKKTGELPVSKRAPLFQDLSAVDFKESLDLIRLAETSFAALPAGVRASFNNDPASLLDALDRVSEPKVRQHLIDAGVLENTPLPEPQVQVSKPQAPKGKKAPKEPELPMED